jgi:hypothetical protein
MRRLDESRRRSASDHHDALGGLPVPGYEATTWSGVGAPNNTSAEIVEKLDKEINAILAGIAANPAVAPSTLS